MSVVFELLLGKPGKDEGPLAPQLLCPPSTTLASTLSQPQSESSLLLSPKDDRAVVVFKV